MRRKTFDFNWDVLKFIEKDSDFSREVLKFIKKGSDFSRDVLQFMKKGSDYSSEVLKFVKLSNQKCWGYDNSQNRMVILRIVFEGRFSQTLYLAIAIF